MKGRRACQVRASLGLLAGRGASQASAKNPPSQSPRKPTPPGQERRGEEAESLKHQAILCVRSYRWRVLSSDGQKDAVIFRRRCFFVVSSLCLCSHQSTDPGAMYLELTKYTICTAKPPHAIHDTVVSRRFLGSRAVSVCRDYIVCYMLRSIWSRPTLCRHFLAHSWTFLSASGQGAKPVQEIQVERVFVWVFDHSHSWRRADRTSIFAPGNIPRSGALVDNCILSVFNVELVRESPHAGLRALYWPVSTFSYNLVG